MIGVYKALYQRWRILKALYNEFGITLRVVPARVQIVLREFYINIDNTYEDGTAIYTWSSEPRTHCQL